MVRSLGVVPDVRGVSRRSLFPDVSAGLMRMVFCVVDSLMAPR